MAFGTAYSRTEGRHSISRNIKTVKFPKRTLADDYRPIVHCQDSPNLNMLNIRPPNLLDIPSPGAFLIFETASSEEYTIRKAQILDIATRSFQMLAYFGLVPLMRL